MFSVLALAIATKVYIDDQRVHFGLVVRTFCYPHDGCIGLKERGVAALYSDTGHDEYYVETNHNRGTLFIPANSEQYGFYGCGDWVTYQGTWLTGYRIVRMERKNL
ncbi:MAG: hypothetical protein LV479_07540 [Methylacidiphilales bacterium]|nr:hypothetical protein [Candidatus Methylacidiphilales bacterium]